MRALAFILKTKSPIKSEFFSKLSDYLPNIERLALAGKFSSLNLDDLFKLKHLSLYCYLKDDFKYFFDFDLLKNICNQLESIKIVSQDIDDNFLDKLFHSHNFPYLSKLVLAKSKITKFEKNFFDLFSILQIFSAFENKQLRKIEDDAFSNLKRLNQLNLNDNCIESIEKCHFSNLTKLKTLILYGNPLKNIKENVFLGPNNL